MGIEKEPVVRGHTSWRKSIDEDAMRDLSEFRMAGDKARLLASRTLIFVQPVVAGLARELAGFAGGSGSFPAEGAVERAVIGRDDGDIHGERLNHHCWAGSYADMADEQRYVRFDCACGERLRVGDIRHGEMLSARSNAPGRADCHRHLAATSTQPAAG